MGIGERDDLAAIARIGEDFLIASERGVEDHFTNGLCWRTDRMAAKNRSVSERKDGGGQMGQQGQLLGLDALPRLMGLVDLSEPA
jgi:hypothetical protein